MILSHLRDRLAADRKAAFADRTGRMAVRHRIDPGSILLVVGLAAGVGVLVAMVLLAAFLLGWFERPGAVPLADERILTNLRDGVAKRPFLDAAGHSDGALYVSRRGGVVHRWSTVTGLWSEERLADSGLTSDLIALQSGCGDDPLASRRLPCPVADVLWGLSEGGGLAQRRGGVWTTLFGDNRFLDRNGKPVEHNDVTAVAASPDGHWLLLGTRQGDVGLYQRRRRQWLTAPAVGEGRAITVARWSGNRFWLGTPDGLDWVLPEEGNVRRGRTADGNNGFIDGAIRDLAAGPSSALLVLEERRCPKSVGLCTRLMRLSTSHLVARPTPLVEETALFPKLDLAQMRFAQFQGDDLVVAGDAGVYAYNQARHAWRQLEERPVTAILAAANGRSFLYAASETVKRVVDGETAAPSWTVTGEAIRRLAWHGDAALALSVDGKLHRLAPDGAVQALWKPGPTRLPQGAPQRVLGGGDRLLVVDRREAVLADLATGEYRSIERRALPGWLVDAASPVAQDGARITGTRADGGRTSVETVDLAVPDTLTNPAATTAPITDVQWLRPWKGGTLLADSRDALWSVGPNEAPRAVVGAPLSIPGIVLRDVVEDKGVLRFATNRGLLTYDPQGRSFAGPVAQSVDGGKLRSVTRHAEQLLGASDAGNLFDLTDPAKPGRLIGSGRPLALPENGPTDALRLGDSLFLGGNGVIEVYDTRRRSVADTPLQLGPQQLGGQRPVRFVGVNAGVPVALTGDRAWIGDKPLGAKLGGVRSVFQTDDRIWTVRDGNAGQYLRGHDPAAPFIAKNDRCLFLNPTLTDAARILDAQPIDAERMVVLTEGELALYHLGQRSWRHGLSAMGSSAGRLHRVGAHLLWAARTAPGWRLTFIATASIQQPAGCESGTATMPVERTEEVMGYAVNPTSGQVAWLRRNGALQTWADGRVSDRLTANTALPQTERFLRVAQSDKTLLFAASDAIWHYSPTIGEWRSVPLLTPSGGPAVDVTMEPVAGGFAVTAVTENGGRFAALLRSGERSLALRPISSGTVDPLPEGIGPLRDARLQGSRWVFLFDRRIRGFDPRARRWTWEAVFDQPDATRRLGVVGEQIVITEGNGQTWWVAKDDPGERRGPVASLFTRSDRTAEDATVGLDVQGNLLRHRRDGSVLACPVGSVGEDSCRRLVNPAPTFDLQTVRSVHQTALGSETALLFLTDAGARLLLGPNLDVPANRREIPLDAGDLIGRGRVRHVWSTPQGFLLATENGRLVELQRDGSVTTRLDRLTGMVATPDGLAAVRDGVALRLDNNALQPAIRSAEGARLARIASNGDAVALDGAGLLWIQPRRRPASAYRLPTGIDAAAIRSVSPGIGNSLAWIQIGTQLLSLSAESCPAESPARSVRCSVVGESIELGVMPLVAAATESLTGLFIDLDDGSTRLARRGAAAAVGSWNVDPAPPGAGAWSAPPAADLWPKLRERVAPRPDGRTALDPVVGLNINGADGHLVATTQAGPIQLARRGVDRPPSAPPLDVGWLRWEPEKRQFIVAAPNGETQLPAERMFVNGCPLFGLPGVAAMVDGTGTIAVATSEGVWRYPESTLALVSARVTFQPVALRGTITAVAGRFVAESGRAAYGAGATSPDAGAVRITMGALTLSSDQALPGVVARIERKGDVVDAFSPSGFRWDRRLGVVWLGGQPVILYPDGAQPAGLLEAGIAPPRDAGPGALIASPTAGLLYGVGDRGVQFTGDRWTPVDFRQFDQRTIHSDGFWDWRAADGVVTVTTRAQALRPPLVVGPNGLGFAFDQLRSAAGYGAGHGRTLLLSTVAWLEQRSDRPDGLPQDAQRTRGGPYDSMEVIAEPDASPVIVARASDQTLRWNGSGFAPVDPAADPLRKRRLVSGERLRIDWDQGVLRISVRLEDPGGLGSRWAPITLGAEGFPFDRVSAARSSGNRLYLATDAGLAIVARPDAGQALDALEALLDLDRDAGDAPSRAVRLGRPGSKPDNLAVSSVSRCWMVRGAGAVPCENRNDLNIRIAVATPFWEWRDRVGAELEGRYRILDSDGRAAGFRPVDLAAGRFAHDRIADATICKGYAALLWQSGLVSLHPNQETGVTADAATYDLNAQPRRLTCLSGSVTEDGTTVVAGLYALMPQGRVRRFDEGGWGMVRDGAADAVLVRRMQGTLALDHAGLRVTTSGPGGGLSVSVRDNKEGWRPLSWLDGRLSLHRIDDVAVVGHALWAMTPDGLFRLAASGANAPLRLDLDEPWLVPWQPALSEPCRADDTLAAPAGLTVRCRGLDVALDAVLDGKRAEMRVLARRGADPFARRPLPADGPWEMAALRRFDGSRGLDLRLWGEAVPLGEGRFPFDRITRLVWLSNGIIDALTVNGGWYQVAETGKDTLPPASFRRPDVAGFDPTRATSLHHSLQNGRPELCVASREKIGQRAVRAFGADTPVVSAGACREVSVSADGWEYSLNLRNDRMPRLEIVGSDADGRTGRRVLSVGRFTDDLVKGFPVPEGERSLDVPTAGGVVTMNADGTWGATRLPPFDGLPDGAAPMALYRAPNETQHLTVVGLRDVRSPADKAGTVRPRVAPPPHRSISEGPGNALRIRRDGDKGERNAGMTAYARMLGRPVVGMERALPWPKPSNPASAANQDDATALAFPTASGISLASAGGPRRDVPLERWTGRALSPLGLIEIGGQMLLVEPTEIWRIDLDAAMSR